MSLIQCTHCTAKLNISPGPSETKSYWKKYCRIFIFLAKVIFKYVLPSMNLKRLFPSKRAYSRNKSIIHIGKASLIKTSIVYLPLRYYVFLCNDLVTTVRLIWIYIHKSGLQIYSWVWSDRLYIFKFLNKFRLYMYMNK